MPIYYNANPLRKMIRKAASRRIDIAGIWNSEGNYLGHGMENGIFHALWPRFQCYGMPAMSFLPSAPSDETSRDQQIGPNWGSGGAEHYWVEAGNGGALYTVAYPQRASAPSPTRDSFDVVGVTGSFGPQFPLYLGATQAGWVAYNYPRQTTRRNPIDISNALTCTAWGAQFTTGGGSFTAVLRRSDSPFTNTINLGTISCSGTDGTVVKAEGTAVADSARASWSALQFYATAFTNKVFASWWRWSETGKSRGFALTPLYSKGSMSMYDMYAALATGIPDASWNLMLDVLTGHQTSDASQQCLIFDIYEGSNFAGESSVDAGAPQPADADHPDNYVWYLEQIISRIQNLWELSGRDTSNLVFRVRCSHPINDGPAEAEVETFRAELRSLDFTSATWRNVTVCDMKSLKSLASMVADGDFYDNTHLTYGGYLRTEKKAVNSLLNTGGGRSRNRGRLLAGAR